MMLIMVTRYEIILIDLIHVHNIMCDHEKYNRFWREMFSCWNATLDRREVREAGEEQEKQQQF